jgi:hypothetical protein
VQSVGKYVESREVMLEQSMKFTEINIAKLVKKKMM